MKLINKISAYVVVGMVFTLVISMYALDQASVLSCEGGDFSDKSVSFSRNIPLEIIPLLRSERGLTNQAICIMPQSKLERALFRIDNPKPDHPGEAAAFRLFQNQDENGEIPPDAIGLALSHVDKMLVVSITSNTEEPIRKPSGPGDTLPQQLPDQDANDVSNIDPVNWNWLGPGNIGGRVRSIVIHPTETNRMWAGSVSGGIWYTDNGGTIWSAVDDFMANLAVSTIIMDPTDTLTMYVGTGEGFYNGDAIRGAGVFKSVDGGVTWDQLPTTATSSFYWVNRLAISPDGNTLLAATRSGIWRSINGGDSWTNVNSDTSMKDVDFHPTDSNKTIAGAAYCTAYYSINGGESWNLASGLPSCTDWAGRVETAYAPGNGDIVYTSLNRSGGEIYSSTDGGQNYTFASSGYGYLGSQGWYDNIIWVDPTITTTVIVGGIDLWRSTDGGSTLTQISEWWRAPVSAHADHHAIVEHPDFDGSTNRTVFFGNDGGVYKTENVYTVSTGATNNGWIELNNELGITQFYGAAGNNTSGVIVGGTQDVGTLRYAGDTEGWTETYGGDGGFCASDPTDPNYFYGEYVRLQIHRSTNGGLSASYIDSGLGDAGNCANFIAPFILDPNEPNRLLAGGCSLWRSNNVKGITPSWIPIKSAITNNVAISAIAVAQGNADIIWVGHNNGNVYRTSNGTDPSPTWTQVDNNSPALPNRYVHRITIDPNDHNKVYVTFGGFSADNIYRTANNGVNWADITGVGGSGLPNVPVRSLVIHPDNADKLYVGTEVGIFASIDGGAQWAVPQDGPANVSVDELFWMDRTLVAATHGRGIYEVNLSQEVDVKNAFTTDGFSNPKSIFTPGETIRWWMTVDNHTDSSATVTMTWDVVDPLGSLVHYWQGGVEAGAGETNLYFEGTVGDVRGTYVFTGTLEHQGSVSQDSTTYLVPSSVLLVDDDDNSPDVISYYTNTLEALNVSYGIWDTGNSDDYEPQTSTLSAYESVIWFSGDSENGNEGPGNQGETALATWLDQNGGCLMISSQDYPFIKGQTGFMEDYLGVASIGVDIQYTSVTGLGTVFGGFGPISLDDTIFTNWSDQINPDGTAEVAFSYGGGNAAVNKSTGNYKTTYWGFPFETLPSSVDRENAMGRFLSWCGIGTHYVFVPLVVK